MTTRRGRTVRIGRLVKRAGIVALAVTLAAGAAPATASTDRPEYRKALRAMVDSGFTGVQLRVHDERGEWAGSAGVSRLGRVAKPPVNGRFRAGSVTKTVTATLVLQLVAEGRIGLDDPVARHLPGYGLDPRITVRMLLQHTSGLVSYTGDRYDDGTVVPGVAWQGEEWVENRFRTYRPEELVRSALAWPPKFAPGTGWHYTNTNYTLALLLIEAVTGQPYADEVRRRIVRPLRLRGTVAPGTSAGVPGPHAHGYYRYEDDGQWRTVDISRQDPSWVPGAGDLISTTADLRTFISALMGGQLLPAALLAEMREPHPASGYGLGLFVVAAGPGCGGAVINHNGGVQGYATLMYSTPDGSRTLTASMTYVDDVTQSLAGAYGEAVRMLLDEFCSGQEPRSSRTRGITSVP